MSAGLAQGAGFLVRRREELGQVLQAVRCFIWRFWNESFWGPSDSCIQPYSTRHHFITSGSHEACTWESLARPSREREHDLDPIFEQFAHRVLRVSGTDAQGSGSAGLSIGH